MDAIAQETGHSRNELIGMFLEYALDHCKLRGAMNLFPDKNDQTPLSDHPILSGLYYAALGRLAAGFFSTLPPETLQAALHDQAAQVLVSIFDVLEDPALDDPQALQKIQALVAKYYSDLELPSPQRREQG